MTPSVSKYRSIWGFEDFLLKDVVPKVMQQQIANLSAPLPGPCTPTPQCCPQGPGAHPVILRANSPATPGTIQDTLPPALPVQRIPNPHVCNASSTAVQQRVEYTLPLRCDKCYIHVVWVCFTLVLFLELLPLPLKPSSAWLTSCVTGLLWQRVGPKWSTNAATWQYVQRTSWRFRC